jgi:hypothetical protein
VPDGLLNQTHTDGGIAHISGQGDACDAGFSDQLLGGFGRVNGAVDGDVGSGFGQRDGNARAEATRGPGDQRRLALQIEFFEDQGNLSFRVGAV